MKILCIHATAGAGHLKAAEALHDYLKNHTNHDVTIVDGLDYTNPLFKKLYCGTYHFMVSKFPAIWAFFFDVLSIPFLYSVWSLGRRLYNKINTFALEKYLIQENYDVILSTHFMSVEVISAMKRSGKLKSRLIACVTDYDAHRIWYGTHVDEYCVAVEQTKQTLIEFGVNENQIHVTGIPVHENFAKQYDVKALRKKFGLNPDEFTVLIATGSFGMGPIEEVVEKLYDVQKMVACGHNQELYERLSQVKDSRLKPFPLVDNMFELMAMADVIVTKPGGLSVSESLAQHLPMIFFSAIPGQEEWNKKLMIKCGAGFPTNGLNDLVQKVKKLKNEPEFFQEIQSNVAKIAKPDAVEQIASLL